MVDMAFFRGGLGRWLPPSVPPVDEAVLLRRCWELLVLDRPGTARLAALGRAPLCRTVLLESNRSEGGRLDGMGLFPQQVRGFGLGVMNARAAYYAKKERRFADFLTDGRSFGPHGEDLVIANSKIGRAHV